MTNITWPGPSDSWPRDFLIDNSAAFEPRPASPSCLLTDPGPTRFSRGVIISQRLSADLLVEGNTEEQDKVSNLEFQAVIRYSFYRRLTNNYADALQLVSIIRLLNQHNGNEAARNELTPMEGCQCQRHNYEPINAV